MIKSALLKIKRLHPVALSIGCGMLSYCFIEYTDKQQAIFWSNKCLINAYDSSGEGRIKSWSLRLTDDAFIRLRKIYYNNRQEYYSFNVHRFTDISYLGTESAGILRLHTKADDIIVQTYNDPKGNVDSMSTTLNIPVKDITTGQLDSLRNALLYLKSQR